MIYTKLTTEIAKRITAKEITIFNFKVLDSISS